MPRREKVEFNGELFASKKRFTEYIVSIIYDIGECDNIKNYNQKYYDILLELIKRHPQYVDKSRDMINLRLIPNTLKNNSLELRIIKKDGTDIDISWKKDCIDGKSDTEEQKLKKAMRSSIDNQTREFKEKYNDNICKLCKKETKEIHVDHEIYFDTLVAEFLEYIKNKGITIPTEFEDKDDGTNRPCFLQCDIYFESEWLKYHYRNAKLRILCQDCNLKRSKPKRK